MTTLGKNMNSSQDSRTYHKGVIIGLTVGGVVFIAGFILCILGLAGTVEILLEGGGLKARLVNGSPGVAFAFLGMIVMWKFKPKITQNTKVEQKIERHYTPSGGYSSSSSTVRSQTKHRSEMRDRR
jgi:hypothetical protein